MAIITQRDIANTIAKQSDLTRNEAMQVFAYFLRVDQRVSPKTLLQYHSQIKCFFAWCEVNNLPPWHATLSDLNLYATYLVELARTKTGLKLATVTINSRLITVRRFFEGLKAHGYITENPAKDLKLIKDHSTQSSKLKCLEDGSIKKLMDEAAKDKPKQKARNQAAIVLMGLCGLRGFEVCNIKRKDIDVTTRSILIHGKHSKDRIMGISAMQFQYIQALLAITNDDPESYLFTSLSNRKSKTHTQINPRGLRLMLDKLLIKLGMKQPKKSLHALRHTCGVELTKKGFAIDQIAALLGHSNINTTKIYTEYVDLVVNPISASLDSVLA